MKYSILKTLQRKLEIPMLLLSFVWMLVIIAELVHGMTSMLLWLGTSLWALFVLFFCVRLVTAPKRLTFLKRNWLFILAIAVSILRFFPYLGDFTLIRVLTATFGLQVIWLFASADQGLRSLGRAMGHKGTGYAVALAVIVVLTGGAGMLYFEKDSFDPLGIHSYPRALWWAAMQMTNIGSGYRPTTDGGQIVCLAVSVFAMAIFGYLTAILATFFVGHDAKDPNSEIAGQRSILQLQEEILFLRSSMEEVLKRLPTEQRPRAKED
jgi:voltage-gated potassium channel